jgi:2'-5' RNA ligase
MRCFIASFLNDKILENALLVQKELKLQLPNWRFSDKSKIHLTYLFLGNNVEEKDIEKIKTILFDLSKKTKTFSVSCKGIGAFPTNSNASVLFLKVQSSELLNLANKIRSLVQPLSFFDPKPFSPHITIARNHKKENITQIIEKYKDFIWSKEDWFINNIQLIQSIPLSGGYKYKPIFNFSML